MPGSRPLRLAAVLLLAVALAHFAAPLSGASVGTNLLLGVVHVALAFALGAGVRALGWIALPVALVDAAALATAADLPLWLGRGAGLVAVFAALAVLAGLWAPARRSRG